MKIKRMAGYCLVLLFCFCASGCFLIEQEIFLNADGSGEMVLYISLPDLPEDLTSGPAGMGPSKNPKLEVEQFKKEATTNLPPTIKLKELKEVRQNGSLGFYAVFQFKNIDDLNRIFANLGKESLQAPEMKGKSLWTVGLEKRAGKTNYSAKLLIDLDDKKEEKKKEPEGTDPSVQGLDELGEKVTSLILSSIKMRFVLHAPSPITETNADIVLREKTAVWNCSFAAFAKDKKPIEMKASFQ
ncbi:MAG: hypothetical protein L0229_20695 [Blastocatellia bacterium]|nr:hypothetical protein [Blastocatellia bacterium]